MPAAAQLATGPFARTRCQGAPVPAACKDHAKAPSSSPDPPMLGGVADARPKAQQLPEWPCKREEDSCSVASAKAVGGSGAAVEAFYSIAHDPKARSITVRWNCANTEYNVEVRIWVGQRAWIWTGPCTDQTYSFRPLNDFETLKRGLMLASVKLVTAVSCHTSIYMAAHVVVPEGYFSRSETYCDPSVSGRPCLVVTSTVGQEGTWTVSAAGAEDRTGTGEIKAVGLSVAPPNRCELIHVYADYSQKRDEKPHTIIGDLWF
jgi:hypothetical protein